MNRPEPDPKATAMELQLDACLAEVVGDAPSPSLATAILTTLATTVPSQEARATIVRWLVAAIVIVAAGVVLAVAWLQRDSTPAVAAPQDPTRTQDPVREPAPTPAPAPMPTGVTLLADYSENEVRMVDAAGKTVWSLPEMFGAWDVEAVGKDEFLVTEFSVSRVRRVDRNGTTLWKFEDLKNPYDADLLPNGNVLIADTFGSRVVEVDPRTDLVVWSLTEVTETSDGKATKSGVRPFDADRLPNGNTLVADILGDRVLEVAADGRIVWQMRGCSGVSDADRLPNGNTLITSRTLGKVIEVTPDHRVVFELVGLSSPMDADRLPNGNTLVAENARAQEFDGAGKSVWRVDATWCVEVNRL